MLRRHAAHPTLGFVLSGCLLWIGGCAGDRSSGGPLAPRDALSPAAVTATRYALRRVDGFTLPRRLCSNAPETITGGAVALRSDGIFNARISYRTTGATISQVQATGTYTVNSGIVTFEGSNGVTVTGTLSEMRAKLGVGFSYCDPPSRHRFIFLRQ